MPTTAKATGYLELNISGFDQAIKTAKNLMVTFAAGFTAYKIGNFFKDGITDAITFGKEMASASRVMGGFEAGNILLVQKALEKSGQGAEEARGHISSFLDQGRSLSDLFGGAENYAAALKSSAADYGTQAGVLTRSAQALQTVWNTMQSVGAQVRTFFLTMTEQFVKPLQAALEYLNQMDLSGMGEAFGKSIADAATLLIGLFKNGDIWKLAELGLSIAFKESMNWLVGGFNWIISIGSGKLRDVLGEAFENAVGYIEKAFSFLSSPEAMMAILEGFVGIATKFTSVMLEGINNITKVFAVGMQMAMNTVVDMFPGMSELLGMNGEEQSFGEMYDSMEGLIPQSFMDSIKESGDQLNGAFSDAWDKFMGDAATPTESGGFEKGSVFSTEGDKTALADMIAKGFQTGQKAIDATDSSKHASPKGALSKFTSDPAHAIADNLAKVGGGGNYIVAGQSLAQKQLAATVRGAKANEELRDFMKATYGYSPKQPQPLGR